MELKFPIYMDYHATTPMDPRVLETMMPFFTNEFGNAASRNHHYGWVAEAAVEKAREQVAALIGANAKEIVWTSGATEGNNLAIKGVAEYYRAKGRHVLIAGVDAKSVADLKSTLVAKGCVVTVATAGTPLAKLQEDVKHATQDEDTIVVSIRNAAGFGSTKELADFATFCRERGILFHADNDPSSGDGDVARMVTEAVKGKGRHIITSATEHKATLDTTKHLAHAGYDVTVLPVMTDGRVDPEEIRKAIRKGTTRDTILVSIMHANNEVGSVNDVAAIGALCRANGVLFHSDAVQSVGKIEVDVEKMKIDLLTMSAHKFYGPKGVGALYVRRKPRVRISAQIDGGGHERGMRSGTLNVPGIAGMGRAAEQAKAEWKQEGERVLALRERMRKRLTTELDFVHLNGSLEHRLPGNLNVAFEFVEGEGILMAIKDVACSSGSACTSATLEPSYVLRAMGAEETAHSSIRFGLGKFTTQDEVDYVTDLVIKQIRRLREMSPLYEMAKEGIDLKSVAWSAH